MRKQLKFNADMLRLVEEGLKTQTRRPVEPQPVLGVRETPFTESGLEDMHGRPIEVKYGFPGDIVSMPRSKFKAKIKDVRVGRLRDISEDDAKAEGCTPVTVDGFVYRGTRKTMFARLWDSIYDEKGFGWDENPWVWVIEFEKVGR